MVSTSFFTDGPTNTGLAVAPAAPAAFYADPTAAAASAAQAADGASAAAASAAAASTAAAAAAASVGGKANIDSPTFTGVPAAPTPSNGDDSTRLATTAWVQANAVGSAPATVAPVMDGTAAVGVSVKYARQDHVHPTDTSRASVAYVDAQIATVATVSYVDAQDATKAPLASPALTGAPTAPTQTAGDNSTKVATTAFVSAAVSPLATLASPALTGAPTGPTPTAGDNSTKLATTAFVLANSATIPDVIIEDHKTSGTHGGTSVTGVNTRDLNTLLRNKGTIASLSSNQFTLGAGTYYVVWSAPAWRVDQHQTALRNVTDSVVVGAGDSAYATAAADTPLTRSSGVALVTIAATKTFSIQHYTLVARATTGLGVAAGSGYGEVYSRVEITKVA